MAKVMKNIHFLFWTTSLTLNDDTKILTETDTETFFYGTKFSETETETFFRDSQRFGQSNDEKLPKKRITQSQFTQFLAAIAVLYLPS